MNPVWIAGNGVVILSCVACMVHLSRTLRPWDRSAFPILGLALFAVTALVTGLQFVLPEIVPALQRDAERLTAGEVWRVVTPLFVQPGGLGQALPNAFFLIAFVPLAERVYGWGMLAIYFAAGIAGQLSNYAWGVGGGGSSTAAFGVMGGLFVYVLRQRGRLSTIYAALAGLGLAGVVLVVFRDSHGVGLLAGAFVALALPLRTLSLASKEPSSYEA